MLTIHGRETSSNVQPVMWTVAELGIEHRRLDVGGAFGGNQEPAFLAMNPMGRIPVIEDGDVILFESQAIMRYLAARYSTGSLWPSDPIKRAPVDQWMEWSKVNIQPVVTYKIFWQMIRTSKAERNMKRVTEGEAELKDLMGIADSQIAKQGWLAGSEITLADITFGSQLFRYFTVPFNREDYPNLKAYYDRLCARPAYSKHVMISFDSLRVANA